MSCIAAGGVTNGELTHSGHDRAPHRRTLNLQRSSKASFTQPSASLSPDTNRVGSEPSSHVTAASVDVREESESVCPPATTTACPPANTDPSTQPISSHSAGSSSGSESASSDADSASAGSDSGPVSKAPSCTSSVSESGYARQLAEGDPTTDLLSETSELYGDESSSHGTGAEDGDWGAWYDEDATSNGSVSDQAEQSHAPVGEAASSEAGDVLQGSESNSGLGSDATPSGRQPVEQDLDAEEGQWSSRHWHLPF